MKRSKPNETHMEEPPKVEGQEEEREGGLLRRTSLFELPSHIVVDIFCELPTKTLIQCRCVSKTWKDLLLDPLFANSHISKSPSCVLLQMNSSRYANSRNMVLLQLENVSSQGEALMKLGNGVGMPNFGLELVGSCRGFLCLYDRRTADQIYLSNPIMGDHVKLPSLMDDPHCTLVCGFGFSQKSNEYKVVRLVNASGSGDKWDAWVFTLGTGKWRSIGDAPYRFGFQPFGTYYNGCLHWILDSDNSSELICVFEVENEQFRSLLAPPPSSSSTQRRLCWSNLGVLGGYLFVSCFDADDMFAAIQIWLMRDYGVKESWKKEFVIYYPMEGWWDPLHLKPIRFVKDGQVLVLCNDDLFVYNPYQESFRRLEIPGIRSKIEAVVHVPSFVMLKDVIGEHLKV